MSRSPKQIARLLTEDPDILNEGRGWDIEKTMEADEVPIGNDLYYVKFMIGATVTPGEEMVPYYSDGSGYPGSPDELEWEVLDILEVVGEDDVQLTPEVKMRAKEAIEAALDDEELLESLSGDYPSEDDRY